TLMAKERKYGSLAALIKGIKEEHLRWLSFCAKVSQYLRTTSDILTKSEKRRLYPDRVRVLLRRLSYLGRLSAVFPNSVPISMPFYASWNQEQVWRNLAHEFVIPDISLLEILQKIETGGRISSSSRERCKLEA